MAKPAFILTLLSRVTPREQVKYLLAEADFKNWEAFRDSLVRRWTNLNVVCGLIMGAISTILFTDFNVGDAAFALGVTSLLSSLISIGFGVGLIYVLGDVSGSRLHVIGVLHTRLYIFALSIPQAWAGVSFTSFFACTCIILWEATNKGWLVRAGVIIAIVILFLHVVGFAYIFQHDNTEYLIPIPSIPSSNSFSASHASHRLSNSSLEKGPTGGASGHFSKSAVVEPVAGASFQSSQTSFRVKGGGRVEIIESDRA